MITRPLIAFIPAAGMGKRLFPVTEAIPKEMFPIGNKPVIQHLIEKIAQSGIKNFVVAINPNKIIIRDYLGTGKKFGVRISYAIVPPHGIDKALWASRHRLAGHPFLYCVGDVFVETSSLFKHLRKLHRKNADRGIIVLRKIPKKQGCFFAVPSIRKKSSGAIDILSFVEKPRTSKTLSSFASVGIMTLPPSFFKTMPAPKTKREVQLSRYLNFFIRAQGPLLGYETKEKMYDCGNIREFAAANATQSKI